MIIKITTCIGNVHKSVNSGKLVKTLCATSYIVNSKIQNDDVPHYKHDLKYDCNDKHKAWCESFCHGCHLCQNAPMMIMSMSMDDKKCVGFSMCIEY